MKEILLPQSEPFETSEETKVEEPKKAEEVQKPIEPRKPAEPLWEREKQQQKELQKPIEVQIRTSPAPAAKEVQKPIEVQIRTTSAPAQPPVDVEALRKKEPEWLSITTGAEQQLRAHVLPASKLEFAHAVVSTETEPSRLKGTACFSPVKPELSVGEFIPEGQELEFAKQRLAWLLQPAIRGALVRSEVDISQKQRLEKTEVAVRVQAHARRWLLRHRTKSSTPSQKREMSRDEAARLIQEKCRNWLDSSAPIEAKTSRKKKKHGKGKKAAAQPTEHTESKLEHFGRLVREARGETETEPAPATPASTPLDLSDKAHLSEPARAHLVEMLQQTVERIKHEEEYLSKPTEADLNKQAHLAEAVREPAPLHKQPEHTRAPHESGTPGHYIQQPRA